VPNAPHLVLEAAERRWATRQGLAPTTLEISPGSRVALVGPSGSGKTTLLRLLMGELRATGGRVLADGQRLATMTPRQLRDHRRRCGALNQDPLVINQLSVHRNVLAGALPGWRWHQVVASYFWPVQRDRVAALLRRVGLAERQWDLAGELSGGEKQRIALARALIGAPRVLLADEPTSALDPTTSGDMVRLFVAEANRLNATLLVSTHRLGEIRADINRVIGLRSGRVTLDKPAADVDEADLDALYEGSRERG